MKCSANAYLFSTLIKFYIVHMHVLPVVQLKFMLVFYILCFVHLSLVNCIQTEKSNRSTFIASVSNVQFMCLQ